MPHPSHTSLSVVVVTGPVIEEPYHVGLALRRGFGKDLGVVVITRGVAAIAFLVPVPLAALGLLE